MCFKWRVFLPPHKGIIAAQRLIAALSLSLGLAATNSVAAAPANDLIENAIQFSGYVGVITNASNFGATATVGDPDYSSTSVNTWYRMGPTSLASTGVVSIASVLGANLRAFELRTNGYVRIASPSYSLSIVTGPNKTNWIGLFTTAFASSNAIPINYSFPTLRQVKPTSLTGFSAPGAIDLEFDTAETAVQFPTVNIYARPLGLPVQLVTTGANLPFQFRWTNQLAGNVDLWAEAVTASGELRRSATNRLTFKCANDNFADAVILDAGGGEMIVRPTTLTREAAEPTDSTSASMWYRWTPDRSGIAQLSMNGGSSLFLYTGTSVGALTRAPMLAAVEGSSVAQFEITAGTTYHVAVYQNSTAAQTLMWRVAPIRFASPNSRTGLKAPLAIDLALTGVPAEVTNVDYFLGTNLIATAQPPFSTRWTNVLTGPLTLSAVARGPSATYYSEIIGLSATPGNDDWANALVLPADLRLMNLKSSSYLATIGEYESAPGIWWKWTPSASGFCIIKPGLAQTFVRSGDERVADAFNGPVSFVVEAGRTYEINLTHGLPSGFEWSIQNCPLYLTNGAGINNHPVQPRPTLLTSTANVARVDYLLDGEFLATATGPDFAFAWTPPLPGSFSVRAKVILSDGLELDGGTARFTIGPENDAFEGALELAGNVTRHDVTIDNRTANAEPGEPIVAAERTVWWKWTPAYSGRTLVQIDSAGWNPTYLVATGASISNLTTIVWNQYSEQGVMFNAQAGTTYYIEIGGSIYNERPLQWHLEQETLAIRRLGSAKPPVVLTITNTNPNDVFTRVDFYTNSAAAGSASAPAFEFVWNRLGTTTFELVGTNQLGQVRRSFPYELAVIPPNDDFADAAEIPSASTQFSYSGAFQNATVEPTEWYQWDGATLWWRWTPAYSGLVTIRGRAENNNGFDAIVVTGDTLTNLQYVARISRNTGATNMEFRVQAGVTYRISFQNYAFGAIDWTLDQETFELFVPMHRTPIELTLVNNNTNETFTDATLFMNGAPLVSLTAANWNYTWNGGPPGKYVFSARATNSLGAVRTTRSIEYWVGPTNDYFADAGPLNQSASTTGNLESASLEPGEPRWHGEEVGSVWYKFIPPATGAYTVTFQTGGPNIAARSAFVRGNSLPELSWITGSLNGNSLMTQLEKGVTYYFTVTTANQSPEPFAFTIAGPPINDYLDNATLLTGSTPTFAGDTASASLESEERPYIGWDINFGSVWYQWTAPITGDASFFADSAPGELAIMVLAGTAWDNVIAHYPYRSLIGWQNGLPMRVVQGTTYTFAIYGATGPFNGHIAITPVDAPPNDFKRDATLLTGEDVRVTGSLYNTTLEIGERAGTFGNIFFGGSIWYRWIAPAQGQLKYWLDNGVNFWTVGLHVLPTPGTDDNGTGLIPVNPGQEIFFQVSCPDGQPSLATLNLQFTPKINPPNDAFADALPITTLPYTNSGSILWATVEAGEPMGWRPEGSQKTLWWSFKPTQSGVLSLNAYYTAWSPRLVVYRGAQLTALQPLPEFADNYLPVYVVAGEEYRIQLQVIWGAMPNEYTLTATFQPQPTNDMFADRERLLGNSHEVRTWLLAPTIEPGEPLVTNNITGTLWWTWTAPSDGRLQIDPAYSFHPHGSAPANLAVYTGNAVDQLTVVRTNGPFAIKARAGATYQIQVYPYYDAQFEATGFNLNFYPFTPATNDNFADAAPLDGTSKSNFGATRELGEPLHAAGGPNKSLWWKFTVAQNGPGAFIRIDQKTVTNVTVAVYQGSTVDTLRLINKGTDRFFFDAWAGETYYVAAETPESDTGDISLSLYGGHLTSASHAVPGNLVKNPSFEIIDPVFWAQWRSFEMGGRIAEIAPDGANYPQTWIGYLAQDIATVPGEKYLLRFVYAPGAIDQEAWAVSFGGVEIARLRAPQTWWHAAEFIVTATASTSELKFQGIGAGGALDQVVLLPLSTPPAILTQPVSTTVFEGAPVLFHVGILGAEPMARQWYFNGQPVPAATDVSLKIPAASSASAGVYYMVATNAYGRAESDHVTLTVESAAHVQIVLQPQSDLLFPGQYFALQTAAVGPAPLKYQWSRHGTEIAGATNSALVFPAFTAAQTGSYTVRVANDSETVTSLPATLSIASGAPSGGGLICFANSSGFFRDEQTVPVFDVDGATKLNGPDYVAQLYAGPTADLLRPVGDPVPFNNRGSGVWPGKTLAIPNVAPGVEAFAQVRAWQKSAGASYESARALGGKFGRSEIMRVVTMPKLEPPPIPEGAPLPMQSFSLKAGLPNFVTGNLTLLETRADGTMTWQLTGAAGFRYLIERQINSGQWQPFTVVTNTTGAVTFTDTSDAAAQIQIYRARMID